MDTEEGVEVVWNEVQFSERKNYKAQEDKIRQVFESLTQLQHPNIVNFHRYWTDTHNDKPRVITIWSNIALSLPPSSKKNSTIPGRNCLVGMSSVDTYKILSLSWINYRYLCFFSYCFVQPIKWIAITLYGPFDVVSNNFYCLLYTLPLSPLNNVYFVVWYCAHMVILLTCNRRSEIFFLSLC